MTPPPMPGDHDGVAGWQVGDEREVAHTFTNDDVTQFADLTGDHNPVHVDPVFAARTALGGQVVHGMLAASVISRLIGMELPGPGALWNSFQVNWRRVIRIGDTVLARARVKALFPAIGLLELDITAQDTRTQQVVFDATARVIAMTTQQPPSEAPLAGTRVLITGASGAVGTAIAHRLATSGAYPILLGRRREVLLDLQQSLDPRTTELIECDLSDPQSISKGIEDLLEGGEVGGLVHAAAAPLEYLDADNPDSMEALQRHWAVEVSALQRLAIGLFGQGRRDRFLVAVLSEVVHGAPPLRMSAYSAAKFAAWGLIRSLAAELGPRGIRCNAVSPGLMETPFTRDLSLRAKQVAAASTPLRRLCTPEDVASVVAFLASPDSGFINGANLPVNGGLSMP